MASQTISNELKFPDGTTVYAYRATTQIGDPTNRAPTGTATSSGTVTGGSVTFTGLLPDTAYWAYGYVSGEHRYLSFRTDASIISESGKGFKFHDQDANAVRPTGYASVEWVGTPTPNNALDGDTHIQI